jgi:glycosyltransferase involved in cell wall biosynthesis
VRRESTWAGLRVASDVVRLALRVARRARRHDFLHANSQKAFVLACLAGSLARRPVIWDLNDLLIPAHFSRTNIRLDVVLANHFADRVIANSRASADALIAQGGQPDKVHVVHNGIAPEPFDRVTDAEVTSLRYEFGLADAPVVGVFGRLSEWKGQHVALDALTHLPDVHLLLVGDALFGEEAYAAALRARASELGIANRVRFLGFRTDVPQLMRLVQVVAHTSIAPEPFGRVIVEGMLARRPVVATQAGGVQEIVRDGETGILVPPGDATALAAAVRGLLEDPVRATRVAAAGRDHAERCFTVSAMVTRMTQCMEEVARA